MIPNHHPETNFAYGYIRADAIDSDLFNELCYSHGKDANYDSAWEDHLAEMKRAHDALVEVAEDNDGEPPEFDEDQIKQDFNDSYEPNEPVYEGEHEGVKYRTSWLGGAQHLYVFESPVLTECGRCSPCVPNAGNLDDSGDYLAYGVPASWLRIEFMQERLEEDGFHIVPDGQQYRCMSHCGQQLSKQSWDKYEDAVEDSYRKRLQHKVGMTVDEIKQRVEAGDTVYWANTGYSVVKGKYDWLVVFKYNDSATGLTHRDGVTLNYHSRKFFTKGA